MKNNILLFLLCSCIFCKKGNAQDSKSGQTETYVRVQTEKFDSDTSYQEIYSGNQLYYKTSVKGTSTEPPKTGISDKNKKIILPLVFGQISNFGNDTWKLNLGSYNGVADSKFKIVLPIEFERVELIAKTQYYIVHRKNGGAQVADINGKSQIEGHYSNIKTLGYVNIQYDGNTLLLLEKNTGDKALYNVTKNSFETKFNIEDVFQIQSGWVIRENTGICSIYDNNLNLIKKLVFDEVTPLYKNILIVKSKNKKGLISLNGNYILPCVYDLLYESQSSGFLIASKGNKEYYLFDYSGKSIFPKPFTSIGFWDDYEGNLIIKDGKKMGVFNISGKNIIGVDFDTIIKTNRKYIACKQNTVTHFSLQGNLISEKKYDAFEPLSKDFKKYKLNNKVGLLNIDFDSITSPIFDDFELLGHSNLKSSVGKSGFLLVKRNDKWGLIKSNGTLVIEPNYDLIETMNDKMFLLKQSGKFGLMKRDTYKIVVDCLYDYISNATSYDGNKYTAVKNTELINFSF